MSVDPNVCEVCGLKFATPAGLHTHHNVHKRKAVSCSECGKTFSSKRGCRRHMNRMHAHSDTKEYVCEVCDKAFTIERDLLQHVSIHSETPVGKCTICGRKYRSSYGLGVHMNVHTFGKQYTCSHCDRKFTTKQNRDSHEQTHTRTHKESLPCGICGRIFTSLKGLAGHVNWHNGAHMCTICNKSLRTGGALTVHMRIHTGEKPYICKFCGATFSDSSNRGKHEKTHPEYWPPPPVPIESQ